jgi:hypothetical protein
LTLNRFRYILKRFNETIHEEIAMIGLPIASRFARELTEEQFSPRAPRGARAASSEAAAHKTGTAAHEAGAATRYPRAAAREHDLVHEREASAPARRGLGRVIARFVHVRG